MSTTLTANIIIATDIIIERAHPLDDSFENNASDHHGTKAANSDVENFPILFSNADEDAIHLHNKTAVTASVPINLPLEANASTCPVLHSKITLFAQLHIITCTPREQDMTILPGPTMVQTVKKIPSPLNTFSSNG